MDGRSPADCRWRRRDAGAGRRRACGSFGRTARSGRPRRPGRRYPRVSCSRCSRRRPGPAVRGPATCHGRAMTAGRHPPGRASPRRPGPGRCQYLDVSGRPGAEALQDLDRGVLAAPFGPSSASTSPRRAWKVTSCRTSVVPYLIRRPATSTTAAASAVITGSGDLAAYVLGKGDPVGPCQLERPWHCADGGEQDSE
jgi:hypothetical protein